MTGQNILNSPKQSRMNSRTSLLTRDAKPHWTPQQNWRIWYLFFMSVLKICKVFSHSIQIKLITIFCYLVSFCDKHNRLILQSGSHHTAGSGISSILGQNMSKLEQFWDIVLMRLWHFMVFYTPRFRYIFTGEKIKVLLFFGIKINSRNFV